MEVKEYISSGVIEAYVLGAAHETEIRELETLRKQHPEIEEAIRACQQDMERLAMQGDRVPPAHLKQKIWEEISAGKGTGSTDPVATSDAPLPVRTMRADVRNSSGTGWIKYLAAAAVLALVITTGMLISDQKKNEASAEQLVKIEAENKHLQAQNEILKRITAPDIKTVTLSGVPGHEGNKAIVYWDTASKEVYLALGNLPEPPKGKQYQLWTLVNGKPVDAGVIPSDGSALVQQLKSAAAADMFAITLENAGGSAAPTLTAMCVAGKI